ncbi:MAG: hypothetical protein WC260_00330 [Candidatus Pacearchaeota archaeon]
MNLKLILTTLFFLIFLTTIVNNTQELTYSGIIKRITIKEEVTFLELENHNIQFVIFTKDILNLKIKDQIKITGKEEIYKGNKQIIVNEIYSLK